MRVRLDRLAGLIMAGSFLLTGCEHFTPAPPAPAQIRADAAVVVDDRQIVVLARTSASADSLTLKARRQGYVLQSRERLEGLGLQMLVFETPRGLAGAAAIRQLESLEQGVTAGVNHAYTLDGQDVPTGRTFAESALSWPAAGCRSNFSTIGMIDGQIARNDPALAGTEIIERPFGAVGATPPSTAHGTATAAILAGPGRLKGVRILNAAVISDYRQRTQVSGVDNLLRALDWLKASDVRLVNISLEGPYNRLLDRGVQQAQSSGMIIVASVGNGGPTSLPRYPAGFTNVIGVTAVDAANRVYNRAPQGPHVDFAAPGVDVFVPVGPRGRYVSGTSFAAPFVTALIAAGPDDRMTAATRRLASSSVDLGSRGRDQVFGLGMPRLSSGCR